jgi:hypothetical protein
MKEALDPEEEDGRLVPGLHTGGSELAALDVV